MELLVFRLLFLGSAASGSYLFGWDAFRVVFYVVLWTILVIILLCSSIIFVLLLWLIDYLVFRGLVWIAGFYVADGFRFGCLLLGYSVLYCCVLVGVCLRWF